MNDPKPLFDLGFEPDERGVAEGFPTATCVLNDDLSINFKFGDNPVPLKLTLQQFVIIVTFHPQVVGVLQNVRANAPAPTNGDGTAPLPDRASSGGDAAPAPPLG